MDDTALLLNPRLIPDYQQWVTDLERSPPNIWSYLSHHSNPGLAALSSKHCWPDFVEVEGCVPLAEPYSAEGYQAWASHFQSKGRRQRERKRDPGAAISIKRPHEWY